MKKNILYNAIHRQVSQVEKSKLDKKILEKNILKFLTVLIVKNMK